MCALYPVHVFLDGLTHEFLVKIGDELFGMKADFVDELFECREYVC